MKINNIELNVMMDFTRKLILRFLTIYFFLYAFPFPLGYLPFGIGEIISKSTGEFWEWIVQPFATYIFDHTNKLEFKINGSGDTSYDYFLVLVKLILASLLVIVWSFLVELKEKHQKGFNLLIIYLRYYLSINMFVYGFAKIFYLQFPELSLFRLSQNFGDASPMGLLWTFMGYSETYSIFTGSMEVLGGMFLLIRRTKILGAAICFAIMLNVFLLNMTYDVPVKLFSFHLVLISLIIISPDYENLKSFFFLNKPTEPQKIDKYFKQKGNNKILIGIKIALILTALFTIISEDIDRQKDYGKRAPNNILYGTYEVEEFIKNNDTLEFSRKEKEVWSQLIIDKKSSVIYKVNREKVFVEHEIDTAQSKLKLKAFRDPTLKYNFTFERQGNVMILRGELYLNEYVIKLKKKNRDQFFLENRGFNWINEYPMNR
ncbi:MAG: hypothetical protein AB3N18_10795 [Allomuricauda sp.]